MGCGSSKISAAALGSPAPRTQPVAEQRARQAHHNGPAQQPECVAQVDIVETINEADKVLELGRPRITDRVLQKQNNPSGTLVIVDDDEGSDGHQHGAKAAGAARPAFGQGPGASSTSAKDLPRQESTKACQPAIVTLKGGHQKATAQASNDDDLSLDSLGSTDMALGPSLALRFGKETAISLSDDDSDDDEAPGFTMQRWKRYYHWNKKKPSDLLRFLWKRFDARAWSVYCLSYRQQDAIFASFQGENIIHGLCCRLEKLMCSGAPLEDLFGVMHTLVNDGNESYKVLGVMICKGGDGAPAPPKGLVDALGQELEEWQISKADHKDPLVRQFVSSLITGQSPVQHYGVVCSRELL